MTGAVADQVFEALAAFANFGFPESHSVSFAHLVYSSAWLKLHYPAAFTAGLLNSQPMGFWSPQSLVADARRHGVRVRRPHVNRSEVGASLEGVRSDPVLLAGAGVGARGGGGDGGADRGRAAPWKGSEDLVRRAGVTQAQLETLAAAGALDPVGEDVPGSVTSLRRRLLWGAGAAAMGTPDRLPGVVVGAEAPPLPEPSLYDSVADDLWALGLAPERTAMHLARERLEAMGVTTAAGWSRRVVRRRDAGGGGRRGHAPPASRDGAGRGVRQPGGRDRARERRVLRGARGRAGSTSPGTRRSC